MITTELVAAVDRAVGSVVFNVSNFPHPAQGRLIGQDMTPLRAKITAAVLAAIATEQK